MSSTSTNSLKCPQDRNGCLLTVSLKVLYVCIIVSNRPQTGIGENTIRWLPVPLGRIKMTTQSHSPTLPLPANPGSSPFMSPPCRCLRDSYGGGKGCSGKQEREKQGTHCRKTVWRLATRHRSSRSQTKTVFQGYFLKILRKFLFSIFAAFRIRLALRAIDYGPVAC